MKSIVKDFAKICYVLLFLISTKTLSQESQSFTITPELSKQIVEKYNLEEFKIYTVVSKEVEYYPYVDGEILTEDYKRGLKGLEIYKPGFDEYNNALKFSTEKKEAIKAISQNIDAFLSSDEKYEIKEKLLIDSQRFVDKYDIKVTLRSSNINSSVRERSIQLYESGKKTNKNDLNIFKEEIQKIIVQKPYETNEHRWYLELQDELSKTQKTETGRALSDKLSKKSVYVIENVPLNINILSGEFIELPEEYSLIQEDAIGKFAKNELITKSNEHYNHRDEFSGFQIIKKSGTNEMYYIMSGMFTLGLRKMSESAKYQNIGNTAEYKAWKTKYVGLLQSAQINVNACNAIISKHTYLNRIGQKRYDSDTFTKQEKMSFNKNLDLLNDKLNQIGVLDDNGDFLQYYNDKASDQEALKSYTLSSYYSTTNRAY